MKVIHDVVYYFSLIDKLLIIEFVFFFRFGAERVLLTAGLVWGFLTFWFQKIVSFAGSDLQLVVFARVVIGAAQGVHFPAIASISSKNLNSKDRGFFFSATTAGSALGTLATGTIGSYMNETYGWPSVFYTIGMIIVQFSEFFIQTQIP